jgi:hypothetical protein
VRASRIVALLAAMLAGCGDQPLAPALDEMEVSLNGSAGQAGAMVFLIQGGAVDSVIGTGYLTRSAPYSGTATQVVVAGDALRGAVVRFRVPDLTVAYTAVAVQVADARTYQLLDPAQFPLKVRRR